MHAGRSCLPCQPKSSNPFKLDKLFNSPVFLCDYYECCTEQYVHCFLYHQCKNWSKNNAPDNSHRCCFSVSKAAMWVHALAWPLDLKKEESTLTAVLLRTAEIILVVGVWICGSTGITADWALPLTLENTSLKEADTTILMIITLFQHLPSFKSDTSLVNKYVEDKKKNAKTSLGWLVSSQCVFIACMSWTIFPHVWCCTDEIWLLDVVFCFFPYVFLLNKMKSLSL